MLARLDALEASDAAHGWLDFARVREAIAAFPDHDQLRAEMTGNKNPASTHRGLAAMTRVVLTEQLLERAVDRT